MLRLQIKDRWTPAPPQDIAAMMLDGVVDPSTPAVSPALSEGPGPLEQFLDTSHFEELGREVLHRLQAMYLAGTGGTDPLLLRERVKRLCDWSLGNDAIIRGRLLWVTAWLEELTGSLEKALGYYDKFLQLPLQEFRLRLLAFNNRGALRIRLGFVAGVKDLARAAIALDFDRRESCLPAACFNLLNLLNVAVKFESLRDQIEPVLVDFMAQQVKDVREKWLGHDSKDEHKSRVGARGGDGAAAKAEDITAALRRRFRILLDPDFSRLNTFSSKLAERALEIAPEPRPPRGRFEEYQQCVARQLVLWLPRPQVDLAGESFVTDLSGQEVRARHDEYAEAASLLYARNIPSSFKPHDGVAPWGERRLQDTLSRSDDYLSAREYDLARSTLKSALQSVAGLAAQERAKSFRDRIEQQLRLVDERQAAHEELRLNQACRDIEAEVHDLCDLDDLCQAQLRGDKLLSRLSSLKADLERVWGEGAGDLMGDLAERARRHLHDLAERHIRRKLDSPLSRLDAARPAKWHQPVPHEAYEALAECRAIDPERRIRDWDLEERHLNRHQVQHHLERALAAVSDGNADRALAEESLGVALTLDPGVGPAVAPMFALTSLPPAPHMAGDLTTLRSELLGTVKQLLQSSPLAADGTWSPTLRGPLVQQACSLLRRLVRSFLGVGEELAGREDGIWDGMSSGFELAIAEGRPENVEEIEHMIEACLDACPTIAAGRGARIDPRNPLKILLDRCARVKLLGRGEEALNAREPDPEAAALFFEEALDLGLDQRQQLRRAAVGLYLSRVGADDPPALQRHVLDQVDSWVDGLAEKAVAAIHASAVRGKIQELKKRNSSEEAHESTATL